MYIILLNSPTNIFIFVRIGKVSFKINVKIYKKNFNENANTSKNSFFFIGGFIYCTFEAVKV